jgi:hypothetical protein
MDIDANLLFTLHHLPAAARVRIRFHHLRYGRLPLGASPNYSPYICCLQASYG